MRKPKQNLIVDSIAFVAFIFLTTTGILMRYVLPPGSGRFLSILGLNRHDWGTIHFWIAVIFLASLATHLILHWNWIVCNIKGKKCDDAKAKFRVALGIIGLLALLALALAPIISPVQQNDFRGKGGPMHNIQKHSTTIPSH
ncbi:MAG TPA: DUF4405 domain-containing protein [Balneolales bacterium]|nr:DUF4405 domain-containing protein [Balneolales bacterium]